MKSYGFTITKKDGEKISVIAKNFKDALSVLEMNETPKSVKRVPLKKNNVVKLKGNMTMNIHNVKERTALYQRCVNNFDHRGVVGIFLEESSELMDSLSKYFFRKRNTLEDVASEMADLFIVSEQLLHSVFWNLNFDVEKYLYNKEVKQHNDQIDLIASAMMSLTKTTHLVTDGYFSLLSPHILGLKVHNSEELNDSIHIMLSNVTALKNFYGIHDKFMNQYEFKLNRLQQRLDKLENIDTNKRKPKVLSVF